MGKQDQMVFVLMQTILQSGRNKRKRKENYSDAINKTLYKSENL